MTAPDHAAALAMLARITPGEWRFAKMDLHETGGKNDGVQVVASSGEVICDNQTYYPAAVTPANARAIAALPELAALYRAAYAYRQAEMDYVFMAERPDEEYVAADVHLARTHMCRAAAAFDAALAAVADKLGEGK